MSYFPSVVCKPLSLELQTITKVILYGFIVRVLYRSILYYLVLLYETIQLYLFFKSKIRIHFRVLYYLHAVFAFFLFPSEKHVIEDLLKQFSLVKSCLYIYSIIIFNFFALLMVSVNLFTTMSCLQCVDD